jgi:dethiobiotin synthetase
MLVEGAGGTLVPLTRSKMMVDLMAALGLPVVVVGRAGLGGINQALLTLECLRARRIRVLAIVLNRTQPNRTALAVRQESSTYEALRSLSGVPVLGPLPHHPQLDCAWDDGIDRMTTHPAIAELGRLILTSNGRTTRRLAPRRERRSRRK